MVITVEARLSRTFNSALTMYLIRSSRFGHGIFNGVSRANETYVSEAHECHWIGLLGGRHMIPTETYRNQTAPKTDEDSQQPLIYDI